MTDNEKRAHDIACALLPKQFESAIDRIAQTGDVSNGVDIYSLYKRTYETTLSALNHDQMDQK